MSLLSVVAAAQNVSVAVDVPVTVLAVDDHVPLTVRLDGVSNVDLPGLYGSGLDIGTIGTSSSMRIVDGVVTRSATIELCVRGSEVGTWSTEPVSLNIGGQALTIDPVTFRVVKRPRRIRKSLACTLPAQTSPHSGATELSRLDALKVLQIEATQSLPVLGHGPHVVFVVDLSSSMTLKSAGTTPLAASKAAIRGVVKRHRKSSFGLVAFAGDALVLVHPTTHLGLFLESLDRVDVGLIGERGSALGTALVAGTARLAEADGERILVLLTDGMSNRGRVQPEQAAEVAAALGIRVHVIGFMGLRGEAVATRTGGQFFHVRDLGELEATLDRLDLGSRQPGSMSPTP